MMIGGGVQGVWVGCMGVVNTSPDMELINTDNKLGLLSSLFVVVTWVLYRPPVP